MDPLVLLRSVAQTTVEDSLTSPGVTEKIKVFSRGSSPTWPRVTSRAAAGASVGAAAGSTVAVPPVGMPVISTGGSVTAATAGAGVETPCAPQAETTVLAATRPVRRSKSRLENEVSLWVTISVVDLPVTSV